jgi:CRP-like cAMP-binding protein
MTDFANLPIFRNVSQECVQLLSDDMVRFFRDGDVIFREEVDGGELVVLLDGEANIFRQGIFLVGRKAGDLIGEQAVVEGSVRSATVSTWMFRISASWRATRKVRISVA